MKYFVALFVLTIGLSGIKAQGQVNITPAGPIQLCSGSNATLQLTGVGSGSVQWYHNNVLLSANTVNLVVNQAGQYKAIVNRGGSLFDTSNTVQVNVSPRPNAQLTGVTSPINTSQGLTLNAVPQSNCTYHWYMNNILAYGGGPNFSRPLGSNPMNSSPGGPLFTTFILRLIVTNQAGCSDTSASITINDYNRQTATVSGVISGSCTNQSIVLTATPTHPSVNLRWRRNGVIIAGATGLTYTTNVGGNYSVEVRPSQTLITSYTEYSNTYIYHGPPSAPLPFQIISSNGTALCPANPSTTLSIPGSLCNANTPGPSSYWTKDGVAITSTWYTHSINVTQPGTYQAYYGNCVGGCGVASFPIVITSTAVNPVTILPPSRQVLLCNDSIQLNAVNTAGKQLQWYRDGQPLPNATGQLLHATQAGVYEIRTTHATCPEISNQVVISRTMSLFVGNNAPFPACPLDSIELQLALGQSSAYDFFWYRDGILLPGASNNALRTSTPGRYYANAAFGNCTITSQNLVIPPYASNRVNLIPQTVGTLCNGGTIGLEATNAAGKTLYWYRDTVLIAQGIIPRLDISQTGKYWVMSQDNPNCIEWSDTLDVTYTYPPLNLWVQGDTIFSDAVSVVHWFLNGVPITATTGNFFIASRSGAYRAIQIGPGGCESPPSNTVSYFITSIDEGAAKKGWHIYPNPTENIFYMEPLPFGQSITALRLYNLQGQLVKDFGTLPEAQEGRLSLLVDDVAAGVFILQVVQNAQAYYERLVIKK